MAAATQTVVLITGGNQGLGFETARNLLRASAHYHVILGSRQRANGEAAVRALQPAEDAEIRGTVSSVELDVTDDRSVDAAARTVAADYGRIDILVNNAGIVPAAAADTGPSRDALRAALDTNVVGAVSVTEAFVDLLRRPSSSASTSGRRRRRRRLVFVSSSLGSVSQAADPASPYHGVRAFEYRASKAALNMLIVLYAERLRADGVAVLGADPGLCATNITGNARALRDRGAATPAQGGERIAAVVRGDRDDHVGRVVGEYGVSPW